MPVLPSGTVTFLFTDIEASTRLLHDLGAEPYGEALGEHRRVPKSSLPGRRGTQWATSSRWSIWASIGLGLR